MLESIGVIYDKNAECWEWQNMIKMSEKKGRKNRNVEGMEMAELQGSIKGIRRRLFDYRSGLE